MQSKTITKTISKKINEWIDSISDLELGNKIKKCLLVSGGCITNMYLGEKVNDYDVYLSDKYVLLELAKHYTKSFNIEIMPGWEKENLLYEYDQELAGKGTSEDDELYNSSRLIAIRSLQPEQVKLFLAHKPGGLRVNEDKAAEDLNYDPIFFSPNAISLSNDLQIVLRFTGDANEIHKNYDFIHATNYYTVKDGLALNLKAVESILTRQLHYQGSKYPLTSIIRVRKFLKRGWNINAGELLKIMFQISELDLTDPDVLEEQLIGVDVAYFGKLIEILRGIDDKKNLTSQYLNEIIDRVFSESDEEQ